MGKWMERAARLEAVSVAGDKRDDRDERGANVSIVPNVLGTMPPAVARGLAQLASLPAPRLSRPELWPEVVADALLLVEAGWAAQALALGWTPAELFGVAPDGEWEGLAIWLSRRRLVLIDECSAIAAQGDHRFVFTRRKIAPVDAIYIWELGREGEHDKAGR